MQPKNLNLRTLPMTDYLININPLLSGEIHDHGMTDVTLSVDGL